MQADVPLLRLIVSGCAAPRFRKSSKFSDEMTDCELVQTLRDYKATPEEVLGHSELMRLLLPSIRRDFSLAATYRYTPCSPMRVPIAAFFGTEEEFVSPLEIDGWRVESAAGYDIHRFEGGHFFLLDQKERVLNVVGNLVREDLRACAVAMGREFHLGFANTF
jgi:medium-chain acyl-[acyl-carrier-protein] hydrolase